MGFNPLKSKGIGEKVARRVTSLSYTLNGLHRCFFLNPRESTTLGRSPDCHIRVIHPALAPVQCRFEQNSEGRWILFSENDQAPVLVNNYPVEFKDISPGDEIQVGPLKLQVKERVVFWSDQNIPAPRIRHQTDFGKALIQSLKKSHWLVGSALVYSLLLFFFWNTVIREIKTESAVGIIQEYLEEKLAGADLLEPEESLEEDLLNDEFTPPVPHFDDLYPDESDPFAEAAMDSLENAELLEIPAGAGDSAFGGASGVGFDFLTSSGSAAAAGGKDWREHIGRLRSKGMDIAILFDSTGSMEGFIVEVKATIKEMVQVLRLIVPDLTMSLMTYKGDPYPNSYVVANTPLVQDPYELLNFMRSVDISGGSARGHAAVGTAMRTAVYELHWREDTEKAIVIIGDAPSFPREERVCMDMARQFTGRVAAIFKPSSLETREMAPKTRAFFKKVATAGAGSFILHDEEQDVVRKIVSAVLGTRWENNIDYVFDNKQSGRWTQVIDRKLEADDMKWFFRQFKKEKARPELVEAMINLRDPRIAREMWSLLSAEDTSPWLFQRSLYLLQTWTGLNIDYMRSQRDQFSPGQRVYVAEYLKYLFGPEILVEEPQEK